MKSALPIGTFFAAIAITALSCLAGAHNLPPAQQLMEPGPGVGGPGPGVLPPVVPSPVGFGMGAPVAPAAAMIGAGGPACMGGAGAMGPGALVGAGAPPTVQVLFSRPEGLQIRWDVGGPGLFDSEPLIVPGRFNFPQGLIYRLKVTNIVAHEGVELYPTLEVAATTPRTDAFLAHNAIPVEFTQEDFDQVLAGNFVTKVIYLPDPEFQEQALVGVGTLVSTRLAPGVDPIVEADRRGAIMAVVRIGNKDVEMPVAQGGVSSVVPAGYYAPPAVAPPAAFPPYVGPAPMVPGYVSGVSLPQWGMPISGTPIGLPGPPHVPLGVPAGLQKHVIRNHTPMHMPKPTRALRMDVRQNPGYSYPKPPSHVLIREQNMYPSLPFKQPHRVRNQAVRDPQQCEQ